MAATLGTRFYTALFGQFVGKDEFGNRYYRTRSIAKHVGRPGKERRWVIYNGIAEPSKIPPSWHGWMHYTTDHIPTDADMQPRYEWEKTHLPNLTGTDLAYRPPGHITRGGKRDKATGDYEAWSP